MYILELVRAGVFLQKAIILSNIEALQVGISAPLLPENIGQISSAPLNYLPLPLKTFSTTYPNP